MKLKLSLMKLFIVIARNAVKPMVQLLRLMHQFLSSSLNGYRVRTFKKYQSSSTTERCFCGVCGSPIISIKSDTPDFYRLRIGTLDTPIQTRPGKHILLALKQSGRLFVMSYHNLMSDQNKKDHEVLFNIYRL